MEASARNVPTSDGNEPEFGTFSEVVSNMAPQYVEEIGRNLWDGHTVKCHLQRVDACTFDEEHEPLCLEQLFSLLLDQKYAEFEAIEKSPGVIARFPCAALTAVECEDVLRTDSFFDEKFGTKAIEINPCVRAMLGQSVGENFQEEFINGHCNIRFEVEVGPKGQACFFFTVTAIRNATLLDKAFDQAKGISYEV